MGDGFRSAQPILRATTRYEEKVVDFLLELAKVTDKIVTKEELFKENEDETAAT